MSKLEVNAIEPQSGTTLTLGASGDTITIPAGATISNSGTAAGFGPTGAVSWNTTKITANPNPAVTGVGYFADTTSAAFTVTLPATPAAGAVVGIADYANTFATNNLTVGRNGSNIGGSASNAILSTNGLSVTFVYVDATQGWIVTDSGNRSDLPTPQYIVATGGTTSTFGNFKIHTFTGPGTFTVCSVGNPAGSTTIDYVVVAGGGGGGSATSAGSGGGGAGGYRSFTTQPVSVQGYPVAVGAGGIGAPPGAAGVPNGTPGNTSTFISNSSTGGGGGGSQNPVGANAAGAPGGSGGGGGWNGGPGGSGNTPPTSPSQGNNGAGMSPGCNGGSGGGAGAVGVSNPGATVSPGGAGVDISPLYGTGVGVSGLVAGGGGGGGYTAVGTSLGGPGGGGNGSGGGPAAAGIATNGTANTGGGGGAAASQNGPGVGPSMVIGAGGSGVVIVRYKFQN